MCGIAGVVGDFGGAKGKALCATLAQGLAHRGPDGEGLWHEERSGGLPVGLVHRRLSIIDLSAAASQPMAAVGGRYHIVFNGEIYNYKALAADPKLRDYAFNRASDTAVLAPLYDAYGMGFLDRLEGMFAIGLWDRETQELLLVRDHAGIKPLYYAETPRGLVFASELKALMGIAAEAGIDLTADGVALQEYVSFLWTPGERTPVRGIRKLRPGHWLRVRAKGGKGGGVRTTIGRWWWPPQAPLGPRGPVYDATRTPARLLPLWDEIVAEQCTADVPLGAFLSGGVDSSAIVASMVATGHAPEKTYCIGFRGADMTAEGFGDDAHYAKLVAQHLQVPLETLHIDVHETLQRLPDLAWMLDEPTADPAPFFVEAISQRARADGLKVLLSGSGGDDVLTGYRRHQSARLREMLGRFGNLAGGMAGVLAPLTRGPMRRRMERLAGLLGHDDQRFLLHAFLTNSQPDAWQLVRPSVGASEEVLGWGEELAAAIAESDGQSLVNRLLYAELFGFLPDHNLNYGDKAGMVAGVEMRVPFTDRRLMQWMAQVNPRDKMRGLHAKAYFKTAMRGRVPDAVLDRSKTGFGAPMRVWMRGQGRTMMREALFDSPHVRALFDMPRVDALWQATQSGHVDGTYTLLGVAMCGWWFDRAQI